jgi:hypothetical protein
MIMKKTMKFFALLVTLVFLAYACKKEMTNESFKNGTATINGTAYVDLDITNDTLGIIFEYVPQGTRIYARINSEDLVEFPSGGVNYGDIVYDTVVGASGAFTFVVAANSGNVTVTFSSDDIMANQVQADTTVESKVFYLPQIFTENVNAGVTRITEVTFVEKP